MSRIYPNIDGERHAINGKCDKCGVVLSKTNVGRKFDIEVSYFNGEDETELYCKQHANERRAEIHAIHRRFYERQNAAHEREENHFDDLFTRLKQKYQVNQLTTWQWRINGLVDVYPKSRSFHDLKRNKRGTYGDVFYFCDKFFQQTV